MDQTQIDADVVIYGASPAGCVAAISARRDGARVVLIEPTEVLGGMFVAGIKPLQDCPLPSSIGGLTASMMLTAGDDPVTVGRVIDDRVAAAGVEVLRCHRVRTVTTTGGRIGSLHLERCDPDDFGVPRPTTGAASGPTITGAMFIDASYEGDLMALAGVSHRIGREDRDTHLEPSAGVQPVTNWTPIDPHVVPGDPDSGLLPHVEADHGRGPGRGDDYTQAMNFRFSISSDPSRRVDFTVPDDHDPADFELVGRLVRHVVDHAGPADEIERALLRIFPGWLNRGDYNYQRGSLVTTAPLGLSRTYQSAGWDDRSRIWRDHVDYLRGLHHFMSTDPRVPADFRARTAAIGLDPGPHPTKNGWPHQLYVRTARRLSGPYTLTQADVQNLTSERDGIGLALYGVDIYPVRRIPAIDPDDPVGRLGVATEGNMFLGGARGTGTPFAVPYRSITPDGQECTNLLVPVCISATHIAHAAIRMEPVFSVLGESAAVAATLALEGDRAVQDIDPGQLRQRLLDRGQVLA